MPIMESVIHGAELAIMTGIIDQSPLCTRHRASILEIMLITHMIYDANTDVPEEVATRYPDRFPPTLDSDSECRYLYLPETKLLSVTPETAAFVPNRYHSMTIDQALQMAYAEGVHLDDVFDFWVDLMVSYVRCRTDDGQLEIWSARFQYALLHRRYTALFSVVDGSNTFLASGFDCVSLNLQLDWTNFKTLASAYWIRVQADSILFRDIPKCECHRWEDWGQRFECKAEPGAEFEQVFRLMFLQHCLGAPRELIENTGLHVDGDADKYHELVPRKETVIGSLFDDLNEVLMMDVGWQEFFIRRFESTKRTIFGIGQGGGK